MSAFVTTPMNSILSEFRQINEGKSAAVKWEKSCFMASNF